MNTNFISCDWGTSAFRLRLVDPAGKVLSETTGTNGIAATYKQWQADSNKNRLQHYANVIRQHLQQLAQGYSLEGLPIIVSGMATSSIGMKELAYKTLPFNIDGRDLLVEKLNVEGLNNPLLLISGVRTAADVIRGEETKVVGCAAGEPVSNALFIFPGTHPKHVKIWNNCVVDFKTYMTGEFFDLLAFKSILAVSVEKKQSLSVIGLAGFEKGVRDSLHHNLLHASFLVRTNEVFGQFEKRENFYYLSGLLIGMELKELLHVKGKVVVAANKTLGEQYVHALKIMGVADNHDIEMKDADTCLISGQLAIGNAYLQ